jgi:hypothetical protein
LLARQAERLDKLRGGIVHDIGNLQEPKEKTVVQIANVGIRMSSVSGCLRPSRRTFLAARFAV